METIDILRDIRKKEDVQLKTSPYLKDSFIDEYGESRPIVLRNYQKQMILNLLMMPNFLCADDTGLGKTLEILSCIGYVWLKEPEFVPIIVTTKSALFQWKSEVSKFMQGMEVVVIHGDSVERERLYSSFFNHMDEKSKKLLLLTYDQIFYDTEPTIARDKKLKPRKSYPKEIKEARLAFKEAKSIADSKRSLIKESFDDIEKEHVAFLIKRLSNDPGVANLDGSPPKSWNENKEKIVVDTYEAVKHERRCKETFEDLKDEVNVELFGIRHHLDKMLSQNSNLKIMLVMDEMHKVKNHKSKFHQRIDEISKKSERKVGMTATPVENRLMEFYSLFRILVPPLFPKISHFQNEFCVTKMQRVSKGRVVPIVVGYKNLGKFVSKIEPYFLSRKKHEVAKDLPDLISREIECELSDEQSELYDMAESSMDNVDVDDPESVAEALKSLTLCQQAVDSPYLIKDENGDPFEGKSSKMGALKDLLEEIPDQKVIIFSRFEKMITEISKVLESLKIPHVRITGSENSKERESSKNQFQDMKSGVNIVLLTTAGSESINLQAAEHFVFIDLPWSVGKYIQLIGRMIRIGSIHKTVVAHHFIAIKQNGDETIDHHVLKALRSKKKLADKVAGNNLEGGLTFTDDVSKDIISAITKAPKVKKKKDRRGEIKDPSLVTDEDMAGI